MLILTRGKDDWLFIGDSIKIKIVETRDNSVVLGVLAPKDMEIFRDDIKQKRYYQREPRQRYFNNPNHYREGTKVNYDNSTTNRPIRYFNG